MIGELRFLIVEDVPQDVVLINHELRKGGLAFIAKRVDTKEQFLHELIHHPPDVILTDHGLSTFDGFSALAIVRDQYPHIPCIFVSGARSEDLAAEAIKSGAVDYVSKARMSERLVPAVRQALQMASEQRRTREAEVEREFHLRELEAALAKFKALSATLPICSRCKQKVRDARGVWRKLEDYLEPQSDTSFSSEVCPECVRGRRSGSGGGDPS